jgi:hypothetical protein
METQERGEMPQEPEDYWINEVNLSKSVGQESLVPTDKDDFSQDAESILALNGLSQNFKRSTRRKINKALITSGGEIVTAMIMYLLETMQRQNK